MIYQDIIKSALWWSSFWGASWQNVRPQKGDPGFIDRPYSGKWPNP